MRPALALICLLLLPACEPPADEPPPAEDPWQEPPPAPLVEPEPWDTGGFLLHFPNDGDGVRPALEAGSFVAPSGSGEDAQGLDWVAFPDEDGTFGPYGQPDPGYYYVAAARGFSAGDRVIVQTTRTGASYGGTSRQPGHFYGDGRPRIPHLIRNDGDTVMAQALWGREGAMRLYTTPDELWINRHDVTPLHLGVGETEERWLGAPVLNLTDVDAYGLVARVVENDFFEETVVQHPGLGAGTTSQVQWRLQPKRAPAEVDEEFTVRLRVASPAMQWSYEQEITVVAKDPLGNHWRTFRSPVDHSVQSFGVKPPADFDPDREYALVLSLHGAGVGAAGQSAAYSAKDWAYIVAPTNRHEFGFDWEEWGRFNALATLDHAMQAYDIDPSRVYLTGHSMGGHGTWHVGVTTPGRFATVAPSAGWESQFTYAGQSRSSDAIGRARAHMDTLVYLENLQHRGAYIIHGSADDNVPVSEGRNMRDAVSQVTDDWQYHEQEGAGHWWDADGDEPGADCVDWEPMFEWMSERRLDPTELDFSFRSPSPSYSPTHSYATVLSAEDPWEDFVLTSTVDGSTVTLETDNVRGLLLDGSALQGKGIESVVVDGELVAVRAGGIEVGEVSGKRHDAYGPFNQAFRKPFCFVHPGGDGVPSQAAAAWVSTWSLIGAGRACMLTPDRVTDALRASHQLIWFGVDAEAVAPDLDIDWGDSLAIGDGSWDEAAMLSVFPDGDRLGAVVVTTPGDEWLLHRFSPFSSRAGMPDYWVWGGSGTREQGFYGPDWSVE